MGCSGCRRNNKSSGSRTKKKTIASKATIASNSSSIVTIRGKKCSKCPFNASPGLTGRCKKGNRMILKAISDPSYKCPIGRF